MRSPPSLTLFSPIEIEHFTAFSLSLIVHTLCLDQLYCCTHNLLSSAVHLNMRTWRQTGLSMISEHAGIKIKTQIHIHTDIQSRVAMILINVQTYISAGTNGVLSSRSSHT